MKNKNDLLQHVKADYKGAEVAKNENDNKITQWEAIRDSKLYGTEVDGKSKYVSDLTKNLLDWQVPSLVDPFVSTPDVINCKPFTYADPLIAAQEEAVLTHQVIQTADHFSFMTDLMTYIAEKGTAFVKTGWMFQEEKREVEQPLMAIDPMSGQEVVIGTEVVEQMVTTVNKPTRLVIDPIDIRMDPTCGGKISKASFVIHDWETDLSTLRQDGRYKNLDKIKEDIGRDEDYEQKDSTDDTFKFEDSARKKIIVHEYWGKYDLDDDGIAEPVVCAWVGDVVIREEENPLPGQEIPFEKAVYKNLPGYIWGEPLAAKTGKRQHIDSVLHRGIFDDMKLANNGQTGTKKGFTDDANLKKMKQGIDFEYNTTMADVYQDQYRGLNQSVFNVMAKNEAAAESSVGVTMMNHGTGGNALGSSAAAVNATTSSSAKREMHIVRGVAEDCIIPMLKKFSRYNKEFLSPEEVSAITDKEYIEPKNDNEYDIKMTLESAETRVAKAERTGFVLQTMGPNMPPQAMTVLLARYMKLIGELDVSHMIENPEVSPEEQQAQAKQQAHADKMMELELALMEAKVYNEQAKGQENAVDVELKTAKTETERAKARITNSDSDLKDIDYLEKEAGIPHERELEKEERKVMNKSQNN
jgi:hypothetical protein